MMTGGLQAQKMVCAWSSWARQVVLDLMFVASACDGRTHRHVVPLEMTLFETSLGCTRSSARRCSACAECCAATICPLQREHAKVRRCLGALEDSSKGQLYVLTSPHWRTVTTSASKRKWNCTGRHVLGSTTDAAQPPPGSQRSDDWAQVRQLSNGIKTQRCVRHVGGCSAK